MSNMESKRQRDEEVPAGEGQVHTVVMLPDIETALVLFDSAAHLSLHRKGSSVVLSFQPYAGARVARKKGESFSSMLCRLAQKALQNQRDGGTTLSIYDPRRKCEGCGKRTTLKQIRAGLLCKKCRAGLREMRAEKKAT